ncbi:hypothetical protein POVCU2_0007920 [Plasmodium ovale curtisi]|uniref:Uncharacterized protein n=1 Tax=Plasmodium ovale curtisi TaxID=864141 RepID=A0A1A8VRL4_PLAOA|nr:hypothetical protein POVCU2_0007920 [Plasmodium ovale curtisi]SBS82320.1 hypothetical protein POVCU1_007100 [Plasmodium ovale curtisi]
MLAPLWAATIARRLPHNSAASYAANIATQDDVNPVHVCLPTACANAAIKTRKRENVYLCQKWEKEITRNKLGINANIRKGIVPM